MVNFTELRSDDVRQNIRVEDKRRVVWHLQNSDLKGQGRVRNISSSGMLLETNGLFIPHNRCVFSFNTQLGIRNYIPKQGKVVWSKRKKGKANKYLCGVRFVEPAGFVLAKLHRRIELGIKKVKYLKITRQTSSGFLTFGIIALAGIVIWLSGSLYQDMYVTNHKMMNVSNQQATLTREYVTLYKDTQVKLQSALNELTQTRQLYQQSQSVLTDVTRELEATKAALAQTKNLLQKAKESSIEASRLNLVKLDQTKAKLNNEIAGFHNTIAELQNTVSLLEEKNIQLSGEMNSINSKLQYYEGNVKNITEGRTLIKTYRSKLKEVKAKVKHFRREASLARKSALKERDRARAIFGNNGFFVQNGVPVKVDQQKYDAGVFKKTEKIEKTSVMPQNVRIDVQIVD